MTAVMERFAQSPAGRSALAIPIDPSLEAHEPPEARGLGRGDVRLLVSRGDHDVAHTTFGALSHHLRAGDALVVNTSATVPAAIAGITAAGLALRIHFSTELPGGLWLVEARTPTGNTTSANASDLTGVDIVLEGGGRVHLLDRFGESPRLWLATATAVAIGTAPISSPPT